MGVALATVQTLHETAKAPKTVRISVRVKHAVEQMVDHARNRAEAAQIAGITDDALYRALLKPEVQAYRNDRMRVLRTSEASRTIARAARLADKAESEHVQLQANTWLAGLEGLSPVQRTENTHIHALVLPGLRIVEANREPAHLIDGQAHEVESMNVINALPQSVPHPAQRNAGNAGDPAKVKTGTRGVK